MSIWIAALAAAALAEAPPAPKEGAEPSVAAAHVGKARRIAGTELASVVDGFMCRAPADGSAYLRPIVADKSVVAARAFDNLYYIGKRFVGAWALKTSDGIVLIDAMNNAEDAEAVIAPGLRGLGLDPADVKLIIVTHGHYDHFGGADWFRQKYGSRILMSAADWDYANDPAESAKLGIPFVKPPARDLVGRDGEELKRGDTIIRLVETPGHTPGTLSLVFTVRDGGKRLWVSQWGGTAMPKTSSGLAQYQSSFGKFWKAARKAGAVSGISSHPFVDDTLGRLAAVRPGQTNPFVGRGDLYTRFMQVHEECIAAQAARYKAWGW
jgi:metallo-beta-lactamase class B